MSTDNSSPDKDRTAPLPVPQNSLPWGKTKSLPTIALPEFPANLKIDPKHTWLGGPSGTSYLTPARKRSIRAYCIGRDGEKCMYCGLAEDPRDLTIHHVDRNIGNNYSDNVQLLHWDCNNDARWGLPSRRIAPHTSAKLAPTPKNSETQLSVHRSEILEDKTTTSAQRTNIENEVEFRKACFQATMDMMDPMVTDQDKFMGRRGMMAFAMEKSGSSQDAAYGYIRKLFAPVIGPLIEEREIAVKLRTVKFRETRDYKLSVEDLVKKYPKEGQVYSS